MRELVQQLILRTSYVAGVRTEDKETAALILALLGAQANPEGQKGLRKTEKPPAATRPPACD